MSKEFYKQHRPKTLKGVLGQEGAIASLQKLIDKGTVPHAILLTGPSGCGKTTIGRVMQSVLNCGNADYQEIDCAVVDSPLDTVRNIRRNMNLNPIEGDCRIWFFEEAQALSRAQFAQQSLLKLLEDVPDHVYFILATTDPSKLNKAVITRCSEVKLVALSAPALDKVVRRVISKEELVLTDEVIREIVEASEGSARKALVILEQIGSLEGAEAQLASIQTTAANKDMTFDLARKLVTGFGVKWPEVAPILRTLKEEDPEGIRYCVLGYARSCMVGAEGKVPNAGLGQRAFMVIEIFSRNFYDSKAAGLAAACWEVVHAK